MTRTAVVWCPDWPVVALRRPAEVPVAVVFANRVVAASASARVHGVERGLRRREAQGRCPHLEVHDRDLGAEARSFEGVARALDAITPRIELTRPGLCAFPTRGPSRYFGGDDALAARIVTVVAEVLGRPAVRVGVADSGFAARLAARTVADGGYRVVEPGSTPAFLAGVGVTALDHPELTSVLTRLGITTLGALAALPGPSVLARFGAEGEWAHRLACGEDPDPLVTTSPPPELAVVTELDPPVERVDQAAFAGKAMADELLARLERIGATCTRVLVAAETEHGEELVRCWRHDGALTAAAVADRIRWQLDGWVGGGGLSGGLTRLEVRPDDVVPARGRQLGFWGGQSHAGERAVRGIARLQGLVGPESVLVPERSGGRHPGEQIVLVPAETVELERAGIDGRARAGKTPPPPWPGALPSPAPARLTDPPQPITVLDASGEPVAVGGRGLVSAAPALVDGRAVMAWAGPWPVEERWWDPRRHRRLARFQVVTDDRVARLLVLERGRWWVAATYD